MCSKLGSGGCKWVTWRSWKDLSSSPSPFVKITLKIQQRWHAAPLVVKPCMAHVWPMDQPRPRCRSGLAAELLSESPVFGCPAGLWMPHPDTKNQQKSGLIWMNLIMTSMWCHKMVSNGTSPDNGLSSAILRLVIQPSINVASKLQDSDIPR